MRIPFCFQLLLASILLSLTGAASAQKLDQTPVSKTEEELKTIDVYKRANEAVVFILTKSLNVDPYDVFGSVRQSEGSGSGIIVDSERGIIITNFHVIQSAQNVEIILADGQSHGARLLGFDREYDIAVIQLEEPPARLASVPFADSSKLDVGQRVLAIGNPFGLNRTLTTGIISSLDRVVKSPTGSTLRGLIQTDAAINPGNSGGPLLDGDGRLIGMNTAIVSQSGDSAGIGFAVPSNLIRRILPELVATGRVLRPNFGWILVDTDQGAMVRWVEKDGAAAKSGVQGALRVVSRAYFRQYVVDYDRADLIYKVNGQRVTSKEEVEDIIGQSPAGKPVEFLLKLGGLQGKERVVSITPGLN